MCNPERLSLNVAGYCVVMESVFFTVPIIVNRMTRSRIGLAPSYHGQSGVPADDQVVCSEFGADIWQTVLKAGFCSCENFFIRISGALVLIARNRFFMKFTGERLSNDTGKIRLDIIIVMRW